MPENDKPEDSFGIRSEGEAKEKQPHLKQIHHPSRQQALHPVLRVAPIALP